MGNVKNTRCGQVFSSFLVCSQIPGVFYHSVLLGLGFLICFMISRGNVAKDNKTLYFYVLYSDATWVFDRSECTRGPIYMYIINRDTDGSFFDNFLKISYHFLKILQNLSKGHTNVKHFPKISKITEDFQGRPEDVSIIHVHQQI